MSRPVSIQREAILDIARKVFMRDGYRASTARIAKEVGISEGSIFKHFKSKASLFLAAMEVEAGDPAWEERLLAGAGREEPCKALESAGLQLLEQMRLTLPRLMMINSSGVTIPKHDVGDELPRPLQTMDVLRRYFTAEVRAGRMSMASPRIQAHLFVGALAHYAWCETLFDYQSGPPAIYVRTLVDTVLKATLVGTGAITGRQGQRRPASRRDSRLLPLVSRGCL
jgi:AcrR family transcriptional regulator